MSKNDICLEQIKTLSVGTFTLHSTRIFEITLKIKKHDMQ